MRAHKMVLADPTIEPPMAHGRWIPDANVPGLLNCSECGYTDHRTTNDFCPACGTPMDADSPNPAPHSPT